VKPEQNEKTLLQGLARNDREAAERIYKDNYGIVQSLIINNNGTVDDARDVFQEAMIVLYEKASTGQLELHCQIRTYVYSVARRIWLKRLQQQSRFVGDLNMTETVVSVDDDLDEQQRRDQEFGMMEKAILSLGEPCRGLLEAFYVQRRSMQEIAGDFGYTNAENAKTQKYKCLMRLKKIFFSHYKNGNSDE
jgi:RNA polymerase sigma factor (sigma-70 family)